MQFYLNVHLVSTEHLLMTWLVFSLATCLVVLGFWASVAACSFVTVFATNMATRCRSVEVESLVPSGIVSKHHEFDTFPLLRPWPPVCGCWSFWAFLASSFMVVFALNLATHSRVVEITPWFLRESVHKQCPHGFRLSGIAQN